MKILVIASAYPPFPAPESGHARMLASQLAERGLEVAVLTGAAIGVAPAANERVRVLRHVKNWRWTALLAIIRSCWEIRPDVVLLLYIDWVYDFHPAVTFAPALARRFLPKTAFVTLFTNESGVAGPEPPRGARHRTLKRLLKYLVGRKGFHERYGCLLRDSDGIIALNEHHLASFSRIEPTVRGKASVVPAPPILDLRQDEPEAVRREGRRKLGLADNDSETAVVMYFGYVYPGKGVETLLRAAALLSRPSRFMVSFKFVVLGTMVDAMARKLHDLEAELGISGLISWLGHVEDYHASTYLRAADVAVLPFDAGVRLNNSSFAVCSAHGLPIVTTSGENLEAPFRPGENVFVCAPRSPEDLAKAIDTVASSGELRRQLSKGAEALARSTFSWEEIVTGTVRCLDSALTKRRQSRWFGLRVQRAYSH